MLLAARVHDGFQRLEVGKLRTCLYETDTLPTILDLRTVTSVGRGMNGVPWAATRATEDRSVKGAAALVKSMAIEGGLMKMAKQRIDKDEEGTNKSNLG